MERTLKHGLISRRSLLALAALGSMTVPLHVRGTDDELARLFSELGSRRERHARFVERKFSALLKAPVEASGTLTFRAPDILEKRTIEPQREFVRIEGATVTYEGAPVRGNTQKRTFAIAEAPLLAALIESLRATLAGDLPALRRHYEVSWTPQSDPGWQLTLTPRDRALRDAVAKIVLRGAAGEVGAVEIVEASGDLTLLSITPLPTSLPKK
jgi:Outer membrane lipoprotein carrier protein LolA-like